MEIILNFNMGVSEIMIKPLTIYLEGAMFWMCDRNGLMREHLSNTIRS